MSEIQVNGEQGARTYFVGTWLHAHDIQHGGQIKGTVLKEVLVFILSHIVFSEYKNKGVFSPILSTDKKNNSNLPSGDPLSNKSYLHKRSIRTVLGFDFGLRHIGIATGQMITATAQPRRSLSARNGQPDWLALERLLATWQPDALIVGIPVNLDGTEHKMTQAARAFLSELEQRFTLPVYAADERLTSVEARAYLFAEGGYALLRNKQAIDGLAAQLIVEGWLSNFKAQYNDS